jgi:hypothetical protein
MKLKSYSQSPERKKLIEFAANYFAKKLNLQNSNYFLHILTKQGLRKNDGQLGLTAKISHKELCVALDNKLSTAKLLTTLAHEMVHVKQFARGQVKTEFTKRGHVRTFWMGRPVKAEYLDRPWEIEAYDRELELTDQFLSYVARKRIDKKNKK